MTPQPHHRQDRFFPNRAITKKTKIIPTEIKIGNTKETTMNRFHVLPLFIFWVGFMFLVGMGTEKAFGFNLLSDLDTNTNLDIGKSVAAGTSLVLKDVD